MAASAPSACSRPASAALRKSRSARSKARPCSAWACACRMAAYRSSSMRRNCSSRDHVGAVFRQRPGSGIVRVVLIGHVANPKRGFVTGRHYSRSAFWQARVSWTEPPPIPPARSSRGRPNTTLVRARAHNWFFRSPGHHSTLAPGGREAGTLSKANPWSPTVFIDEFDTGSLKGPLKLGTGVLGNSRTFLSFYPLHRRKR